MDGQSKPQDTAQTQGQHNDEPHNQGVAERLNWLRAGVLGANDGIVSVAAVVVGVAGATTANGPILAAGAAAAIGGAISMALGEYVSVSSSADSQRALIEKERQELEEMPEEELAELTGLYEAKGLSRETAAQVARELTEHDALAAHLDAELQLDQDEVLNPWNAAIASAIAFSIGAALPFATAVFLPGTLKIPVTFIAVMIALAITGALGARLGGAPILRPTVRVLIGGAAALAVTFAIGSWLGVSGVL